MHILNYNKEKEKRLHSELVAEPGFKLTFVKLLNPCELQVHCIVSNSWG